MLSSAHHTRELYTRRVAGDSYRASGHASPGHTPLWLARLLNKAWQLSCQRRAASFLRATSWVVDTQLRVLTEILQANHACEFGRTHGFAGITSPRDPAFAVPLAEYADFAPHIERMTRGEQNILTSEPVLLFEPTSGTSAGEKLIPYTPMLRRQFQAAIAVWMHDLLTKRPALQRGRAYWSISPPLTRGRTTPAGIPIGFDDDQAYLGRFSQWAARRLSITPRELLQVADPAEFRQRTLLCLLAAADLTLVSIWNPTFFTTILQPLAEDWPQLVRELEQGSWPIPTMTRRRRQQRAAQVRRIMQANESLPEKLHQLWPQLQLLSCWTDGAASHALPALRELLPHVEIQPKGLLATEAFVSIPLLDRPGAALAIESHFFEFVERNDQHLIEASTPQMTLAADELTLGGHYEVIVTTGGGLYRYRLHDEIEVVGFENECPLIRFVGKTDLTSDLVGEKLGASHVEQALDKLCREFNWQPTFMMLTPHVPPKDEATSPTRYRLYLQLERSNPRLPEFASRLQTALEANPYYKQAVQLCQLRPLEIALLDPQCDAAQQHLGRCNALGQRLGNIKPNLLDRRSGWDECFAPWIVQLVPAMGDSST